MSSLARLLVLLMVGFSALASATSATANVTSACQACSWALGTDYYFDSSRVGYINEIEYNWSETCWLRPRCAVKVTTASNVGTVLRIIEQYQVLFAVRSGGHNPNAGFSSIDGSGILINLSSLKELSLNSNRSIISVGPGNQWINVYNMLNASGISAIGTKEPGPGVGGSVLGGGDPFFPNLYGMICDNVVNFEVVLSNASIVQANEELNSDLFRALKGGGPNLGIVSRYDIATVPLHNVWSKFVAYSSSQNHQLLHALVAYQDIAVSDPKSNIIFNLAGNTTVVGYLYAAHVASPAIFANLSSIPPLAVSSPATNGTVAGLSALIGAMDPAVAARRAIYAVTTKVHLGTYQGSLAHYNSAITALPAGASLLLTLQPYGQGAVANGAAHGGNTLGITSLSQTLFAIEATWIAENDTTAIQRIVETLGAAIRNTSLAIGSALPFVFQNDASYVQKPLSGIGAANVKILQEAIRKYDPHGVFQNLQNSGFLLSRM